MGSSFQAPTAAQLEQAATYRADYEQLSAAYRAL
jgi:hypothetical protein